MKYCNNPISSEKESLSCYFKEIKKIPLLSREEEIELGKRIQKGDEVARNKLIESNLRFVIHVARKYHGAPILDLIEEGNMGLIIAAKKYDYSRNNRFISYAQHWIKSKIERYLSKNSIIPLPRDNLRNSKKVKDLLETGYSIEDISKEMFIPTAKVLELANIPTANDSIFYEEGGERMELADNRYSSKDDFNLRESHLISRINEILTPKEADVLRFRLKEGGYSLEEISMNMKVSRQTVNTLQKKAIRKIKSELAEN